MKTFAANKVSKIMKSNTKNQTARTSQNRENQATSDNLKLAVQIMSGLLASGHFTEILLDNDRPVATRYSPVEGERFRVDAVAEAVHLLRELKQELDTPPCVGVTAQHGNLQTLKTPLTDRL
jgi:hypothetical protein